VAGSILLAACSKNKYSENKLLSEEKMVDILVDVQWLKAYQLRSRFSKKENDSMFYDILETYNITQTELDSNLSYYSKDAERLEKMYSKVIQKLEEKQLEAQ